MKTGGGTLSRNNVFVTRKVRPEELCVYVCVCVLCFSRPSIFLGGAGASENWCFVFLRV